MHTHLSKQQPQNVTASSALCSASRQSIGRCIPTMIWGMAIVLIAFQGVGLTSRSSLAADDFTTLEKQFLSLPIEARRLTGPLFWLHGDESKDRLESYLQRVVEGGNGCFTAESRPHNDWLGPGWYRDLKICLDTAKRLNLTMWIFDEEWWPSGEVGGRVPQKFASKYMQASTANIAGPTHTQLAIPTGQLIAVLAGRRSNAGIEGESLIDLTDRVHDGQLDWDTPAGAWQVMTFSWQFDRGRNGRLLIDGASKDAVDWYIRTVYQPHYDHFGDEFGKTIVGYFYDEPETWGDWGTEVIPMLKQRGVSWQKALVAWKFQLSDPDEQVAAKYQYQDAFAEAWGRTLYGGLTQWCHEHHVSSIGHWLEHGREYLDQKKCAGNMFQVQKYSDMGAIDAVFKQFVPGHKDDNTYQTPKLGSSISHAYGKTNDLTMVEIFGARGQDLSYPEMKWWTDLMQVAGVNFHIPHSFNPRSPFDRDCPPYFYNSGYEPRWPLYRIYADYTSRLSLLLSGGRHVCPVALLYLGNSYHAGDAVPPEEMTTALQDALFDCDWLPYDVFESNMEVARSELHLHDERYRVLIVPAVDVIPYATLAKAREFYDAGGTVVAYGMLPSKSATLGKTATDIAREREAIWGSQEVGPTLELCQSNAAGGKSYFLPEKPTPQQLQQVLTHSAGIHPTLEVLAGETDHWLHVLHRVKAERHVFLIANQQHEGLTKRFRFRVHAPGTPELWDAMRNSIRSVPFQRIDDESIELSLTLEPLESVLLVFQPDQRPLPMRIEPDTKPIRAPLEVTRVETPTELLIPSRPSQQTLSASPLATCSWVWYPEPNAHRSAAPGTRFFRKRLHLAAGINPTHAEMRVAADNQFTVYANGHPVGNGSGWQRTAVIDLTPSLHSGDNVLAIAATNATDRANPAGLIGHFRIANDSGPDLVGTIDATWKANDREIQNWNAIDFDDRDWQSARTLVKYGDGPWGDLDGSNDLTVSPVVSDPFVGRFVLPADWPQEELQICLEVEGLAPEAAAAVTVNEHEVGGFIGRPCRLEITSRVQQGENIIILKPFAPAAPGSLRMPNRWRRARVPSKCLSHEEVRRGFSAPPVA